MPQWLDDYLNSKHTSCTFTASGFDPEQFEFFMNVLKAYGLQIDCNMSVSGKTAAVSVRGLPDSVFDAKVKATRTAGRKIRVTLPKSSVFNSDTSISEFMDWAASHKVSDTMTQLGISSRPKYYRVLNIIKEYDTPQTREKKLRDTKIRFTQEQ